MWIAEEARPLSIVEDTGLREWVEMLTSGAHIPPCFDTVRTYILELASSERASIKKEVKDLKRQGSSPHVVQQHQQVFPVSLSVCYISGLLVLFKYGFRLFQIYDFRNEK